MSDSPQRLSRRAVARSSLAFLTALTALTALPAVTAVPAVTATLALGLSACGVGAGHAAVSLRFNRVKGTPRDAGVWIDEEFIGPLHIVAAHGVRLPVGEHRITIQKSGYFPWDRLVVADRAPIHFDVVLEPIPD